MKIIQENHNASQPYILLDFSFSFENDVAHDDICRTVIEIIEGITISKCVDFKNRNTLVLLAKTLFDYVSIRTLEELSKTDVRFMIIAQNQKPSHQAFQRFIHDDLTMSFVLMVPNMKPTPIRILLFGVKIQFETEPRDA